MLVGWMEVARADTSYELDVLCCSYHFDRSHSWNEMNPGVMFKYYPDDGFYFYAGGYRNSYDDNSLVGGIGWREELSKNIDVSLSVGLATGYENNYHMPVLPQIIPAITFYDRINVMVLPAGKYSVVGLSATIARW
jgi:hypothetical protein